MDMLLWALLEIALAGLIQDSLLLAANRLCTLLFFQAPFSSFVILQIYQDAKEREEIKQGIYWPWSYRRAVSVMELPWWHF